jgi:hypothetical protein
VLLCQEEMELVRRPDAVKEEAGWEETRLERDLAAIVFAPVVEKKCLTNQERPAIRKVARSAVPK